MRYDKDAWHRIKVLAGEWPAGAANKPGRPVRMEVLMRWVRMKYPDGMSFYPAAEPVGWKPKHETRDPDVLPFRRKGAA